MLSWFWPQCPIRTIEKVWVESRMTWLAQQLGPQRLLDARVVVPTDEFFPGNYRGTADDAQRVFRMLREQMQIEPQRVHLEITDELYSAEAVGEYENGDPATIRVRPAELEDPESLVGTLTHELAHEILLGGGILQDNNHDLERLTDLTQVYLGVGIFGANSALREQNFREGRWSWWTMRKKGYLPMRMYGYGMSLFAWARGERRPPWARYLRPDVREPLQVGLRFLHKTSDSTFDIHAGPQPAEPSVELALIHLNRDSAAFRMLGLQMLFELGEAALPAANAIAQQLQHRDADVSCAAAYALGTIGRPAVLYAGQLQELLRSRRPTDRESAAVALGELTPDAPEVIPALGRLLEDDDRSVAAAAAAALGNFGPAAARLAPSLLKAFHAALIRGESAVEDALAMTLHRVIPDAADLVRKHFAEIDSVLQQMAVESVEEAADSAAAAADPLDEATR